MARMISLYVAGDLVGAREREVAAHLAACEECRRLAEEFSESSSLLTQACMPPEFGAEFYSGIRDAVLGEITRDRMLSKPSLFRPRWLYATAFAAIVIASGVMLQHFGSARRGTPQGLALAPQVSDQPTSGQAREANSSSLPQLSESPQAPRKSRGLPGTLRAQSQKVLALVNPHGSSRQFEAVRKPNASDTDQTARDSGTQIEPAMPSSTRVGPVALESATLSGGSASSLSERASDSQVSRIEIQTADPNIRIIWLSPRESREPEENNHDKD
jgi:hypothetical protein